MTVGFSKLGVSKAVSLLEDEKLYHHLVGVGSASPVHVISVHDPEYWYEYFPVDGGLDFGSLSPCLPTFTIFLRKKTSKDSGGLQFRI